MSATSTFGTISTVEEFTIEVAANRAKIYDTVLHRGRRVTEVEARIVEAQFRLPDGSTLLMLNDDEPFKEMLTLVLVGPGLKVLDRMLLGGAFTPGYLTYAYPIGPDEIAFCWHDLDQVVTVRSFPRWFGLRSGWLRVREVAMQPPRPPGAPAVKLTDFIPAMRMPSFARERRSRRRGRALPSLVWFAWLSARTFWFDRRTTGRATSRVRGRARGPKP